MKYLVNKTAVLVFHLSCRLLRFSDFLLGKNKDGLSKLRGYVLPEKPIPSLGFAPVIPGYIVQLTIKF